MLQYFLLVLLVEIVKLSHGGCLLSGTGGQPPTVHCDLRILDFRRNSSDVPGIKSAEKLQVQCSDVFFFESQLRSDHFGSLPHLRELSIGFCKIRQLPPRSFVGLTRLKSLAIHTYNADWTSMALEPDYESLIGLDLLEHLDLTNNNLASMPGGLLCPLVNIASVNVSNNVILDLEHLGLSHRGEFKCNISVESLYVRNNGLRQVTPSALASLHKLKVLDFSQNEVGVLVEEAFKGLTHLEKLDVSNNRLTALPPKLFHYTKKLQNIQLANNTIGTIDLSVFANLTALQVLNLSGNSLDENWIKTGIFNGLHNLIILDLSSNHMSRIDSGLFQDLNALQVLDIGYNQLHSLSTHAFVYLHNLHSLVLSHNDLETIHHETLAGLSVLHSIAVDHNKLHSLHPMSLKNCSAIQEIRLNNNILTQVPSALHHIPSLRTADLSSNVIGVLNRESFQGLPKLETLRIRNNELSRIEEGSFKEVPLLQHLDLSVNRFSSLHQEIFTSLKHLKSLNLAENQLEDINGLLTTQINLKWLNISNNRLAWFDYAFIPPGLEWVDISHNIIDSIGNYYSLRENYSLKVLNARKNRISSLEVLSVLPSLQEIYLEDNMISHVAPNTFLGKPNITIIHLERNKIQVLEMTALMISVRHENKPPSFYFADNPFVCNCHLQWFKHLQSFQASGSGEEHLMLQYPLVGDMDQISCRVLNHSDTSATHIKPISRVRDDEFLCPYDNPVCLPLCMCCDFFACDCQMKCPDNCSCFRDKTFSVNIVECVNAGHTNVPSQITMEATDVRLDGSNLTSLDSTTFIGRGRLHKLYLSRCKITEIENQTFAVLGELKVLDLSQNELKQLRGDEFHGLTLLRELHLQQNQLVSIHESTFKGLKYLTDLRLDGNLLIAFPVWHLTSNPSLSSLTLSSNWWHCECEFVRKFRAFIDANLNIVRDAKTITCTSSETNLNDVGCSDLVSSTNNMSGNSIFYHGKLFFEDYLYPIIGGILAIVFLAIFLVCCACKRLKEPFKIWIFEKYGFRCYRFRKISQGEKVEMLFESLVIYSVKDENHILDFARQLGPSYRLCLNHRDLSGIYTSEAFKSAVKASHCHIIFVSNAFLDSEWDHMKDIDLENTFVILLDDLEDKQILRDFLKRAKRVLKSKDPCLAKKMRYYLPDPPALPTKEGGAELDVSGVWTFTPMSPDIGIDESGTSAAKLLRTPNGRIDIDRSASTMLSLLGSTTPKSFPAPPMRKRPHQCSTHSIGVLSGSTTTCSTPLSVPFHRSIAFFHDPDNSTPVATRSCGTNVSNYHQRSVSAVADHRRTVSYVVDTKDKAAAQHQRSLSSQNTDATCPPPALPPKVGGHGYSRGSEDLMLSTPPPPPAPSQFSFLHQLVQSSPHPELLDTLRRHQLEPRPIHPAKISRSPSCAASVFHHQRAASMLEPNAVYGETPAGRYVKHIRSSSTLAQTPQTPRNHRGCGTVHHRSASNVTSDPQRSSTSATATPMRQSAAPRDHSTPSRQLHKSTSNLISQLDSQDNKHQRSASTPYEGFVV